MVSIESTAAGREGHFYEYCQEAERMRKEGRKLSAFDFKIMFFPWWEDSRYALDGQFTISREDEEYFKMLKDKHNIILNDAQKRWYIKKKKINGDKMFSEYPSTLDEAFLVQTEGSYFQRDMQRVYLERRIRLLPHDPMLEVSTWWDLGMDDFNVILLVQVKAGEIRFINMYWNRGEGLSHYYEWLTEQRKINNYRYSTHYLPHDVEVKELGTGVSRRQILYDLGMRNIHVCPKANISDTIDQVRRIFTRFYFDEEKCSRLHEALANYRKDFDAKLGKFKDHPRHDENGHFVDPVRALAMNMPDAIMGYTNESQGELQSTSFFG